MIATLGGRRLRSAGLVLAAAFLPPLAPAGAADVDDARLLGAAADTDNWLIHGRDYANQRFSPLTAINAQSIARLVPKWIYQTGTAATFQTTPLVADGVMYVSAPGSSVMAVDAVTGREIWRYDHKPKAGKLCCGPANRGVALGYGKVFIATVDARLIALAQDTGKTLWDIPLAEDGGGTTEDRADVGADPALKGKVTGSTGIGAASAPLVFDGKVYIGITGVGYGLHLESERPGAPLGAVVGIAGRYGRPGFLAAFDVGSGQKLWQFDTTQEGWEGQFSTQTPDGIALPRDIAAEKAAVDQNRDAWRFGGGSVWHAPAADPALGLIYFGVGNPSPQAASQSRPGDNLHTVSIVALDAATGKLRWHYQQVPHDMWGYDVASPPSLFDVTVDGKPIPALGQASKLGWYYVLDRRDGRLLFKSEAFVPQSNMFQRPTKEGTVIAPGVGGGANWSPAAIDARKGVAFVAAMHMPTRYRIETLPAHKEKPALTYYTMEPDKSVPWWGTLSAIDVANGGKILWQQKTDEPLVGGVLATAGGLVFNGEGNGFLSAFDARSGTRLWQFNCGAGVNAPPISYAVGGKQYVAVAAGGSQIWGFRQGGAVISFGLAGD